MSLKINCARVWLAIALSLTSLSSAFAQPSIQSQVKGKENESRSQYLEIEVADFIQRNNITPTDPRSLAGQLLSQPADSLEGRQQEEIAIDYGNRDGIMVVEHTIIGLADDSVRSIRTRIELQWQQSSWDIIWVGSQFQCRSGRGHQDWSGELCY